MSKPFLAFLILIAATTVESFGDAVVRIGLFNRAGLVQVATILGGGALLLA